jgi:Leucine-rich repeat (LRR) protein
MSQIQQHKLSQIGDRLWEMCQKIVGNNLQSLAPDLESLTNLRELNLSYNKFESVPTAILSLSELKYLNLAGNHLKHVVV